VGKVKRMNVSIGRNRHIRMFGNPAAPMLPSAA
jgi:hypothetical protein